MKQFDEKTKGYLKFYVYMLVDPETKMPFYVGKGKNNRVFAHLESSLSDQDNESLKYETIKRIQNKGLEVEHLIIRHGLDEDTAFELEAALIDTVQYLNFKSTNLAGGHNSVEKGLMTADEIIRLYNAEKLDKTQKDTVVVNINRKYKRGFTQKDIYEASKSVWPINSDKIPKLKFVLSEYKGLIVEVFSVDKWYEVPTVQIGGKRAGQTRLKYAFEGRVANDMVRNMYINKSISHKKKKGMSNSIMYLWD